LFPSVSKCGNAGYGIGNYNQLLKKKTMDDHFIMLEKLISSRRTIKPQQMNGGIIPDEKMNALLALADFAPTHGGTEPWRFIVYGGKNVIEFCNMHAAMYLKYAAADRFEEGKYEKLLHMGDKASHIVVAVMKRGSLPKIPDWEEKAATACAIQNVLLGATALGIATYWGSGGMAQHPAMKTLHDLKEEDFIMGILYFGYADKQPRLVRNIPMNEKIKWID
jgi:nitroreductase